jgi:hypothetical protein
VPQSESGTPGRNSDLFPTFRARDGRSATLLVAVAPCHGW